MCSIELTKLNREKTKSHNVNNKIFKLQREYLRQQLLIESKIEKFDNHYTIDSLEKIIEITKTQKLSYLSNLEELSKKLICDDNFIKLEKVYIQLCKDLYNLEEHLLLLNELKKINNLTLNISKLINP